ncbi:MAG: hypothetical protein K2L92_10795 [Muribaculaceae bacterium]|nr:hypothetical protein [Muribaculaceae bacterium]
MKSASKLIVFIISLIVLSCDPIYDNKGYPSKVKFSNMGGEKIIQGNDWIRAITVDNGQERIHTILIEDSVQTQLNWLTIKATWGEKSLTLIAAPKSEADGPKEIKIECSFGREAGEIKVIRK